ncbi:MAG: hemerythrin family protein [Magnetococcales bacterium]|nr:hemerythrin family protein [Magnetococcales bacterium]
MEFRAIPWDDRFNVDVEVLDMEHKKLLDMINELGLAMAESREIRELTKLWEALIDYTAYHFKREETLLDKHGYPGLFQHQEVHRFMRRKVRVYREEFLVENPGPEKARELMVFLEDWLFLHIQGMDKKYCPHLEKCGVR